VVKIAVISDVHSNLEALEAVLERLEGMDLYCLGDLVGYGASPNEVLERLRERRVFSVMGNHDYAVLNRDTTMFNPRAAAAVHWTADYLSEQNREYLRTLPMDARLELGVVTAYLTHGSPDDSLWEYVDPTTHSLLFGHYLRKLKVGLLGLGHTHIPYVWPEEEGMVFNPGSVGQPRDGDPRASYAVVTIGEGKPEVETHRVEYDCDTAAKKIREGGLPDALARRLFTGT
jgi:putative phosphoesterase